MIPADLLVEKLTEVEPVPMAPLFGNGLMLYDEPDARPEGKRETVLPSPMGVQAMVNWQEALARTGGGNPGGVSGLDPGQSQAIQSAMSGGSTAGAPSPAAPSIPLPGYMPPPQPQVPTQNVPFGYNYLDPILQALIAAMGLQVQQQEGGANRAQQMALQRQEQLYGAGQSLAALQAAGPASAAELAFRRAGLGLPAIGNNTVDARNLLTSATRGGGGTTSVQAGDTRINLPATLNAEQLRRASGDPLGAGVLNSFGRAGTGMDLITASLAGAGGGGGFGQLRALFG